MIFSGSKGGGAFSQEARTVQQIRLNSGFFMDQM
jgi:hypothetical protein